MSVCPSPKGEGILLSAFLCDGALSFQANVPFQEQMASPHLGRRERGSDVEEKYERARIKLASDYSAHGRPHPTTRETPTPILRMLVRVSRPRWRS